MKVRNIIFSGFAAAILMGTANAATAWSIASKAYVDSKVSTGLVDESTGKEISVAEALAGKADASDVETLSGDVDALKDTVGDSTDGLVKDVADLQGTVGDSTDGLVKDVADLQGTVGDTTGGLVKDVADNASAIEALDTRVTANENIISNGTETLPSTIGSTQNVSTIVGAINALQTKTDSMATSETMNQVTSDIDDIKDALGAGFDENNTVADALADKANATDVEAALGDGIGTGTGEKTVAAALGEKQDAITATNKLASDMVDDANQAHKFVTATDVTNLATLATLLSGYASCASSSVSGHCVLSADTTGMSWVDVTDPYITVEP